MRDLDQIPKSYDLSGSIRVKLIDVYPNGSTDTPASAPTMPSGGPNPMGGFQQLVRADVLRGKFRNSLERPEPFTPGRVTPLNWSALDVLHTFRKGHRLMVQIQSTWFPLVDQNPQRFVNIQQARAEDFRPTTQRVYRGPRTFSYLELGVLP